MQKERWVPIQDFEHRYEVSSNGNVRSVNKVLRKTLNNNGYHVVTFRILGTGKPYKKVQFKVHQLVWRHFQGEIPEKKTVDHINRDRTDNRLENLRIVSYSHNALNSKKSKRGFHSIYKGVRRKFDRSNKIWEASISVNKKRYWLGNFNKEIEAAIAYDLAAIKYAGKAANTNLIKIANSIEVYDSI